MFIILFFFFTMCNNFLVPHKTKDSSWRQLAQTAKTMLHRYYRDVTAGTAAPVSMEGPEESLKLNATFSLAAAATKTPKGKQFEGSVKTFILQH